MCGGKSVKIEARGRAMYETFAIVMGVSVFVIFGVGIWLLVRRLD